MLEVAEREEAHSYDAPGAKYTHRDGKCSFEALVEDFELTDDAALVRLAGIVHAADVSEDKNAAPEGAGLSAIAGGFKNKDGGGPGSVNALDERTCEIARDIAASFNVTDTLEESRQRVADLYSGYGEAASPAIAAGIREWVSGLTSGNLSAAADGVSAVDSACSAEGF